MPTFKVLAEHLETHEQKTFFVDNITLKISETEFPYGGDQSLEFTGFSAKEGPFATVKIQMGLKCNFTCGYCSQAALPEEPQFNLRDLDTFIDKFLQIPLRENARVQLWGGEPFVYWKYIKHIVERLHAVRPDLAFSTISNGSLLTAEHVDFFAKYRIQLSISHDGPGQAVRGPDPLDTNIEAIRYCIEKLNPIGLFCGFNSMLSVENPSRLAVIEFFNAKFPDLFINSGEMGFLKTTGAENYSFIEMSPQEHFELRRNLWAEMRFHSAVYKHCPVQAMYVTAPQSGQKSLGMKCGMDKAATIAIDLNGNILTCHNLNASSVGYDGNSRVHGNLFVDEPHDFGGVTHWSQRSDCPTCPVLNTCKGSCMLQEGKEWDLTCEIEYTDKIAMFAIGFEQVTGYVPIKIDDETLPLNRQDIWGTLQDWSVAAPKKTISIKEIK
jgi:uncharacterized protein